jgi:hypothetical protein
MKKGAGRFLARHEVRRIRLNSQAESREANDVLLRAVRFIPLPCFGRLV